MNSSGRNGSNSVSKNVVKSPVVKQDWQLARRELLKGLGVGAACLPLLQATRSYAQAATGPRRLAIFQMSEGLRMAGWKPNAGSLMGGPLPPSVAAFEPFKAETMFLHGMNNPGGGGGHGSYGCVYYGLGGTGGGQYKEPTGKTVDQVVAAGAGRRSAGRACTCTSSWSGRRARPPRRAAAAASGPARASPSTRRATPTPSTGRSSPAAT